MSVTFKYDFKNGDFVLSNGSPQKAEGKEALQVWIEKCLRTPANRYLIYKNQTYGANIEDLTIGKSYGRGFVESELKREIKNSLLLNDEITDVTDVKVSRERDKLYIDISIDTIYGTEVYTYDN